MIWPRGSCIWKRVIMLIRSLIVDYRGQPYYWSDHLFIILSKYQLQIHSQCYYADLLLIILSKYKRPNTITDTKYNTKYTDAIMLITCFPSPLSLSLMGRDQNRNIMVADGSAFHISFSQIGRRFFHICLGKCSLAPSINVYIAAIKMSKSVPRCKFASRPSPVRENSLI